MVTHRGPTVALIRLVHDCLLFGMSDTEAQEYVSQRVGRPKDKPVSLCTIQRYRTRIQKGDFVTTFLNNYVRYGFALEHENLLNASWTALQMVLNSYRKYMNKHGDNARAVDVYHFQAAIDKAIRLHNDIAYGTPVISQLKARQDNLITTLKQLKNFAKDQKYKEIQETLNMLNLSL